MIWLQHLVFVCLNNIEYNATVNATCLMSQRLTLVFLALLDFVVAMSLCSLVSVITFSEYSFIVTNSNNWQNSEKKTKVWRL